MKAIKKWTYIHLTLHHIFITYCFIDSFIWTAEGIENTKNLFLKNIIIDREILEFYSHYPFTASLNLPWKKYQIFTTFKSEYPAKSFEKWKRNENQNRSLIFLRWLGLDSLRLNVRASRPSSPDIYDIETRISGQTFEKWKRMKIKIDPLFFFALIRIGRITS